MRAVLVFIDGVGLGEPVTANPFVFGDTPFLRKLLRDNSLTREMIGYSDERVSLAGLNTTLGVAGLPQSATGQAAIFTGINASRLLGFHLNGFPNQALRDLLSSKGIFGLLKTEGYQCNFINAYLPPFFKLLRQGLPGDNYSCSTLVTYYGGLDFHTLEDVRQGKALYMDITNFLLVRMGCPVAQISPEEGGRRLIELSMGYDFTMFEYFLSDLAGHLADRREAGRVVETLDRFLGALTAHLDPAETLLIVTSDHGNLEDLSCREHTLNPVPLLLYGPQTLRCRITPGLKDLTDILPAIKTTLSFEG